jgi:SAM-dependent methyltransferase
MIEIITSESERETLNADLQYEINEIRKAGYEVSVGYTEDMAYERPYNIDAMFDQLDIKGKKYSYLSKEAVRSDLGATSLASDSHLNLQQAHQRRDDRFEEIRANLLFDDTKMPWHLQRGSALALQTIVNAHELIAQDGPMAGEGSYSTMSGQLALDINNFTFDDADGSVAGLGLRDSIMQTRQRFCSESEIDASKKADELLSNLESFIQTPITQDFKDIVAYCYDSLGIRSRKQEVNRAILNHVDQTLEQNPNKDSLLLLSVGCGTAQSILEVASDVREKGIESRVVLLDQDPISLMAAKNLAGQMGLSDVVEIHCERLFDQKGQPFDMEQILKGRTIDVAEDTGLREYLPDRIYRNLTNVIWDHLASDGIMTTGNMNTNRPQSEFLHGLMGWQPRVIMRNIAKGFKLHEQSGIPKGSTKARVTRDGVYTLFFSYK